jgi:hypothetical protein
VPKVKKVRRGLKAAEECLNRLKKVPDVVMANYLLMENYG